MFIDLALCCLQTGTIYRHFFLGNDRCSDDGPVWLPDKVVLLPNHSAGTPPTASKQGAVVVDSVESAKVQEGEDVSLPVAIHACRSRGCSIDVELAEAQRQLGEVSDGHSRAPEGPDVVIDDPCEWLFFKGNWGTTCAPINQRWLHDAETPTSRSSLQRIFFHLWPETESV